MERQLKDFYAGKKVLVTGGAGFIGSHLVDALVGLEAKVTVLDNFSTGSMNNLRNVLPFINLQYADITSAYSTLQGTANKDVVFHLAAFISVPNSVKYPAYCQLVNEVGTANTLNACIKNGVKSLVFSSSAAVYGNKTTICHEEDTPNPQSPYASSKLAGEALCKDASLQYGLATTALRYFNVYGERQNPNGEYAAVVAKFTECLQQNTPITIFGNGLQTRDFIHVSQVVKANLIAGMHLHHAGEIFNVATGTSITLLQLISQLEEELKLERAGIIFKENRDGDIQESTADNTRLTQLFAGNMLSIAPAPTQIFAERLS